MVSNYKKSSVILKQKGVSIVGDKTSIVNADESAKIVLDGYLRLNVALPKGSKSETLVTLCENSVLNVNGNFQAYYNTEIYVFKNAVLDVHEEEIVSNYESKLQFIKSKKDQLKNKK